jgi:hypothetical protein
MKTKLYNLPIKTFDPENLMYEILKANDGDVFIVHEENVAENIGDYKPELTMLQVKKVREPDRHEQGGR